MSENCCSLSIGITHSYFPLQFLPLSTVLQIGYPFFQPAKAKILRRSVLLYYSMACSEFYFNEGPYFLQNEIFNCILYNHYKICSNGNDKMVTKFFLCLLQLHELLSARLHSPLKFLNAPSKTFLTHMDNSFQNSK